jgi:hypothetical protein
MNSLPQRAAVLGAGIMGSSVAFLLARHGANVSLFDRQNSAMACASRWNEGKIHLGYLYGADSSLRTARHILPGGLAFGQLITELISSDIRPHVTVEDDLYLVHRNSLVSAEQLQNVFDAVSELVRSHPNACSYLKDASTAHAYRLRNGQLEAHTGSEKIVAGFRIPERSINTQWVATQVCAALSNEPKISLRMNTVITAVRPVDSDSGRWHVFGSNGTVGQFDLVINALWEGRLAVDHTAGLTPEAGWTHRYRRCIFVRTRQQLAARNAVIVLGPFGDVKSYSDNDFYLSWYPVGLVSQSGAMKPELPDPLTMEEERRFVSDVRAELEPMLPWTASIFEAAEAVKVEGGFVYALGEGPIGDPASSLHRRDQYGVRRRGNYISLDTGKYSTAPWLADRIVRELCGQ